MSSWRSSMPAWTLSFPTSRVSFLQQVGPHKGPTCSFFLLSVFGLRIEYNVLFSARISKTF